MKRQIFTAEHDAFRESVRTFLAREVLPHYEQWEKDGIVSRDAWLAAGKQGLLGLAVPEEYGGGGNADFRYSAVLAEMATECAVHPYVPRPLHCGSLERGTRCRNTRRWPNDGPPNCKSASPTAACNCTAATAI